MDRRYLLYCRVTAALFILNTVYPVVNKIMQDRLAGDWLHSVLHLGSAVFAIYAGWFAASQLAARWFTWGIGILYFALGIYGWFSPGFFLNTPFALPLGPADNIFHLILSLPALVIILLELRTGRQPAQI